MKNIPIICCLVIFMSCKKEISTNNFKEFENSLNLKINNQKVFDSEKGLDSEKVFDLKKIIFTETENYFGELDKTKLRELLAVEIKTLEKNNEVKLKESSMAIIRDTTQLLRKCGTYDTADSSVSKGFSNNRMLMPQINTDTFNIPINFYIVDSEQINFTITENLIDLQIIALNKAFSTINIVFYKNTISRYIDNNWYLGFSSSDPIDRMFNDFYMDMIDNLPLNPNQLNVIINGCNLLGQASFPFETTYRTKDDNIIINRNSLPNIGNYQGDTLIHEMGHFFGLYHTFHSTQELDCDIFPYNGCEEGDLVEDTPPQMLCYYYDCNAVKSCDEVNNIDVKNFMGYNPDSCMDYFTEGQYNRMEKFFYSDRFYLNNDNFLF